MATLAVEVDVLVVVLMVAIVAIAQFIAYAVATVFQDVYQMMLTEEGECTEDARLVDRQNLVLQF